MNKNQLRKHNNKTKKQIVNVTFNYSKVNITQPMQNILNKGLKFAILPDKIDITQMLVDLKYFERIMYWQEYFHGTEQENREEQIFKERKTNLPKNHRAPEALRNYLGAVKSELMDPLNRNKVNSNIPPEERKALKELIQLQKTRQITVKPCDKGAGIIVLDFHNYLKSCYDHLKSKQNGVLYYEKVDHKYIEAAKKKLKLVLDEGFNNEILSKEEYRAMDPAEKQPAKFYCTFKVHKPHKAGETPPVRPIVSGSGSITENTSLFVQHHIREQATKHESYLKDTPDFLRKVEKLNQEQEIPENAILATIDISAAFTNIPQDEGAQAISECLNERENKKVPTEFIVRLLEIIHSYNIFEFNSELYTQIIGSAMGQAHVPAYADMFFGRKIDPKIKQAAVNITNNGENPLLLLSRYLDDIFTIFRDTTKKLHEFLDKINQIHPNIKFTMTHTAAKNEPKGSSCDCQPLESIPFLDTSCSIRNRKLVTKLYRKPTDRNQYLLTSSCHPASQVENIPFSLALRIVRICSLEEDREEGLGELRELLLQREYGPGMVDAAISRARAIPREVALRPVANHKHTGRPIHVVTFDPRLPDMRKIHEKNWRSMKSQDPNMGEVFPKPPLVAFKRQKNIKDYVIRAKVPPLNQVKLKRNKSGMKRCGQSCPMCPYVKEGQFIKNNRATWKISSKVNCSTQNIIYLIECNKERCKKRYIGETERSLKERFIEHKQYVKGLIPKFATGEHFNEPGHSLENMTITIIEKVKKTEEMYRKEREKMHISKFNTYHNGLNRKP